MNEQAIIDSYNLFVQNGYNKSLQDFKQLISSNPNALNDSYGLFQKNGYKRSLDDYKILVGVGAPVSPEAQAPVAPELKKKDDTTALPSGLGSSVSSESVPKEEDYFQGTFGNILRGFDSVSPIGIGDFADDMARAVASGYRQGDVAQAANKLLISGTTPSLEEIQNLLDKQQKLEQLGGSKEFQDYQKTYEEAGKGVWGFVKGVIQNPSILPEIMISSMVSMATNRDAVIAGLGAVGTGATAGAVTAGGLTLGAGAAPGAVAGAVASVPYAFGLASTIVETGATFSELLNEELGGKDSSAENVKAILEDPEKLNDIRNKAIARGITIGAIDAFTGKLASGVGAKILSKSAAGSATGAATKAAVTKATVAGTAIEAAGGSTGEAAARGLIGQDMDTGEILLEGIAEMPGGVKSTLMARFAKPIYKVNGRDVDAQEIDNLLETMTPEQLAVSKIDIKNDYEGRQVRLQDKIVTNTIKEEVKQAQPDLNEPTVNAIVDLQKQLNTLEGNKTEVAKDKVAQIRAEIKNLQENPLPEAIVQAQEIPSYKIDGKDVSVEAIDELIKTKSKEELLAMNIQINNDKTGVAERLQAAVETKPIQQDAIQEQAAGQVPVQSGATVSQEVAQGEPQAGPQVTAEEGQAKEVTSTIELAKEKLSNRVSGNKLLDSQDLIDELNDNKAEIDEEGMVTVYHRTTPEKKAEIEKTGKMKGLEDGVFFSTKETGQNEGYGDAIVKLKIPVEQLTLDDTFGDEAHLRIPTTKAGQVIKVKEYLQVEPQVTAEAGVQEEVVPSKTPSQFALELQDKYGVELDLLGGPESETLSVSRIVVPKEQRGKGVGAKVIEEVVQFADSNNKKLVLTPSKDFGGTSVKRLTDFYKRFGFVENKGKNKDFTIRDTMYRVPKAPVQPIAPQVEVTVEPEAVSPAVSAQEEVVTPQVTPARKETFEELMERSRKEAEAIEAETKDFNSRNEREYTGRKDKSRIKDDIIQAEYDVFYAKKRIGSADDVEAAVNEYNKAKEKVSELQEEINQIDNFNEVDNLISEEIEKSKKPNYEYRKLFEKDPRLASIEGLNSLIDFLKTIDGKDDSISLYERYIKNLEEDIKKYPIKKQVSPTSEKKAVSPTVSPKPAAKKSTAQNKRDEIISRPAFTPIAIARQWLLLGGKLLPKQSEENKRRGVGVGKGVQEETGMSGIEIRALGDVTDNKRGISIEMAAGKIWQGLSPELQASMDDTDIRNAMIDILMSENRKSWIENQDRDTSEDDQSLAREEFEYAQLTEQERADFDEYQQEQSYSNYLEQNAKRLAKEYDAYIKSKTYQDYIEETYERDRQGQNNAQNKNDRRGKKQGSDAGTAPVQGREQAAKTPEVEAVINEDTGTLESALDFLDGLDKTIDKVLKTRANDALLGIPLTALQGMVKGLKALVQGGMKLRDAIKRIAEENNISQDKLKELLDLGAIAKEFNEVMARADKLIARQKSKNIDEKKILTNLETKLRKEPVYINATDTQRKIMEREARARMGAQPRKAASIGRVIGVLKDITNVTKEEKLKIISRIRELGRDVTKDLAAEIRELAASGKITANQAASIVARTLKINPLNEASVTNFVDYMAKVFSKADYVGKMTTALSKIKQAKKNIKTKIGVAQDLFEPLNQLLSINPTLIPLNQLEKYLGILEDFGERKAVLTVKDRVKVLKQVNEILEEISNEQSLVDVLADRFNNYDGQVFNEEGGLNYAVTIKKMIDDGKISTDEADLMRKYKSEVLPQVERTDLTEEEIAEQKKEEIKILKALKIDNKEFPLPSRDEKEDALNLEKLIKELSESDLMNLSLPDLKNIIKVIENINNGYLPHYAKISIEKLDAIKEGKVLSSAIERAKPLSFSKLYSRLKDKFTNKGAVDELIRANPLYYIDNVFGDFKTRDIFNSLLEQSSQALARFNSELKRVSQKIDIAQNKVLASFNQNPDKYLMSKFRMTTYMLQREYESNIGKKGVRPVSDYLKETIKHIRKGKSVFKEADAEKLEKILEELDTYTVDGTVDLDKFYNTFNNAEKNAIKVMTEINASLGEKAAYTSSVIRGNKVELMDNYFHHNVLHEQNPMDATAAPEFSSSYSNSMRPTTKAKSLIERTGALTPLNFDLFTSTQKGAKFVLLDYNLTSPIRTARRTLIQAEKNLESKGLMNKEKIQIFNAINNAYEEALENILTNNISQDDLSNEVFDFIQKQGYRAALAGTTRFQAELASNIVNALIINPKGFATGIKHAKLIASANGYEFMKNAKSKQTSRLYSTDALSGRMVDPQILKQTSGIKGSISRSALRNRTAQIYNLTLKRFVQNPVEYIADTMLTTPDKVVSMPLWFGSFMNEFKRITGEEVNQEMMINNDLDYMQKYADAIEQATRKADQESVYSGAANNEFMGVLKGKLKPNQGLTQKLWNNFNSYMTNFMNFDYAAARSAVYNLFNEGYMTKKKAAAVLAGITTRSVIYQVMVANMGAGLVGAALGLAFDWEDEEEVDEKSYFQMIGRGLSNVLVGYTLGRNFGNAVRGMINFGVEKVNEEYLDFLRNGEYDFYKDNIAYTYLNVGDRGDIDVPKMAISMAGAYTPALNTAVLIGKNFGALSSRVMGEGPTKKEPEAIRREDMTVNYRIPLEVAGNLGLIPLYKDVKKAVNDEIYKDLRKAANTPDSSIPSRDEYEKLKDLRELKSKIKDEDERKALDKKIVEITGSEEAKAAIDKQKEALTARKKRLLYDSSKGQRYDNESDMKRLNPSLWRKRFGPNSEWAKKTKAKEAVESKLEKESKAREDREFKKKKRGN